MISEAAKASVPLLFPHARCGTEWHRRALTGTHARTHGEMAQMDRGGRSHSSSSLVIWQGV